MALIHTLMALKDDGVVINFDMMGAQKAKANLINGKSLILYMANDYIIGRAAIREAVASDPIPDYILYNNWSQIVEGSDLEAKKLKIPFLSYGKFRYALDELLRGE